MNKKGLIGKILAVIGIIFLILILIIGITGYQAYSLVKTIQEESSLVQSEIEALSKGDCTKLQSVKDRIENIKSEAQSACINPLIKIAVDKIENIEIKCKDLENLENMLVKDKSQLAQIENYCSNKTTYSNVAL